MIDLEKLRKQGLTTGQNSIVHDESGKKYFIKRRSKYSEDSAIRNIAIYGLSNIIDINSEFILESFVDFTKKDLSLEEYVELLHKIHSNNEAGLSLVHGDFSKHNTTFYENEPTVFDYEHAHWGDIYVDIGRVILRETESVEESIGFLKIYFGNIPSLAKIRDGIVNFCYWQNKIREEKHLPYSNVPLIRAERVNSNGNTYSNLIMEFKRPV